MIRMPKALAALVALAVAGCASIASGTTQTISVSSNVEGAEIFLDGVSIGATPFTGPVEKNKDQLRVEADGYRTETLAISKSLDPMFWGNIIIGGTLGSITDFATGAAYQYAPAAYQVDLQRPGQSAEDFQQEVAVRKFAMIYLDEIAVDLSNGGGDYLSALVDLINADLVTSGGGDPVTESREAVASDGGDPVSTGRDPVTAADVARALEASRGYAVRFGREVTALR